MNKILISLLTIIGVLGLMSLFVRPVSAQSCLGETRYCCVWIDTYKCSDTGEVCNPSELEPCPGGGSCDRGTPTQQCENQNVCAGYAPKEVCELVHWSCSDPSGNPYPNVDCYWGGPVSSPTPTPPSGGGGCTSTWCTSQANCEANGGTWSSGAGFCATPTDVRCCVSGGGGGGTGADPCPGDSCAGFCCNYQCVTQPCIVTADCAGSSIGQPVICEWGTNPTGKYCRNANCLNNTDPGTICACSGNFIPCGQKCAGGCEANSTCRFTNAPSGSCTDTASTYCIGNTGDGTHTYNPSYTTPQCLSGDTGNKYLLGPGGQTTGFTQAQINSTCKPTPWWQVKDGDVITNGRIQSVIPVACVLPGCNPNFNLDGAGGFPGVVSYGSATAPVFSASGGSGKVSSKGWLANTTYVSKPYQYSFFEGLIPPEISINEIPTDAVDGNYFQVNGTPSNNFVWFRRTGNLRISGTVNVNSTRKVILLVKGGDLTVSSQIRLKQVGDGFFMAVVNGSIFFDPTLTGNAGQPAVEGLFMADNQIRTGSGNQQLYVRGTLAAYGGIVLERDLGDANPTKPAEFIEYAPDFIFSYPRYLTRTRVIWKEVAP